jgi:glycosyltransferase involved in cell wall biosynthesis
MFDVVYMLGYGSSIFCFIPRLWGSTVWINMDGVEWARSKWSTLAKLWFKLMEAAAMWTPDRIIADAEGILRHLKSRHHRLPAVSVIPYGAPVITVVPEARLLDEWCLSAGRYYLVVCRLEPENSVREIIKGFLQSASEYPLIIVGSIDRKTAYIKELLTLGEARVCFVGTVYDAEKLQALRYHALAYLHGHTVGGTNPSLLEALGCGNIVIAHNNVYNREVAGNSATYFYQENEVAECIEMIGLYLPGLLQQIKARAQERVKNRYSWDAVIESYYATLLLKQSPCEQQTRWAAPEASSALMGVLNEKRARTEIQLQRNSTLARVRFNMLNRIPLNHNRRSEVSETASTHV